MKLAGIQISVSDPRVRSSLGYGVSRNGSRKTADHQRGAPERQNAESAPCSCASSKYPQFHSGSCGIRQLAWLEQVWVKSQLWCNRASSSRPIRSARKQERLAHLLDGDGVDRAHPLGPEVAPHNYGPRAASPALPPWVPPQRATSQHARPARRPSPIWK